MEVKRATFESINEAQLEFIFDVLLELENKNETVDQGSRRDFFDLFAFSLVGKGLEYPFNFEFDGNWYTLASLSSYARKLCFLETNEPEIELKGMKTKIPIKLLWKALRENMYKPMDEALTLGLKSSAELLGGGSSSHAFNPEQQKKGNINKT